MPPRPPIRAVRLTALLEGVSYLILLGYAMPMKYWAGDPVPVRIFGSLHGALFIALVTALAHAWRVRGWTLRRCAVVFIASLIPVGAFLVDPAVRRWDAATPHP